jgi:hypothetical protein
MSYVYFWTTMYSVYILQRIKKMRYFSLLFYWNVYDQRIKLERICFGFYASRFLYFKWNMLQRDHVWEQFNLYPLFIVRIQWRDLFEHFWTIFNCWRSDCNNSNIFYLLFSPNQQIFCHKVASLFICRNLYFDNSQNSLCESSTLLGGN